MFRGLWGVLIVLASGISLHAEARRDRRGNIHVHRPNPPGLWMPGSSNGQTLVAAVQNRRRVHFVQANDLVVTRLLADDTRGTKHQKFVVRIANGAEITIVSNLELCERVPVRVGDVIGAGGEFIWTKHGGLLHWVHFDPRGLRPHGFIRAGGRVYCQ